MAGNDHATGYWRSVEAANWLDNPGFQFTGLSSPDSASDGGYVLTPETASAAARAVEWMYDPATGQIHFYAVAQFQQLTADVAAKGLTADDEVIGSDHADHISVEQGNDRVFARAGNDDITGGAGDDALYGDEGDDTISGGSGSDRIHGGAGYDTVRLEGLHGANFDLFEYFGTVYSLDKKQGFIDAIVEVEAFQGEHQTFALGDIRSFDPLTYAASYNDLALRYRSDAAAALAHYIDQGSAEGRASDRFDAMQYLENYRDLKEAFGSDQVAATEHFLTRGVDEHRLPDNPLEYIASFDDLVAGFRGQSQDQLIQSGLDHYQQHGFDEGRRAGIDFSAKQYLANYADLRAAFGENIDAAATHFIEAGSAEHRFAGDAIEYVASSSDLIQAFGGAGTTTESVRANGLQHFGAAGFKEERNVEAFDVDNYLANYADLRAAFSDGHGGYDEAGARLHFVQAGYFEGRTDLLL